MNKLQFAQLVCFLCSSTGREFTTTEIEHLDALTNIPPTPGKINLLPMFEAMRDGEKINAIKEYRSLTGEGLRESKDAIEMLMNRFAKPYHNDYDNVGHSIRCALGTDEAGPELVAIAARAHKAEQELAAIKCAFAALSDHDNDTLAEFANRWFDDGLRK